MKRFISATLLATLILGVAIVPLASRAAEPFEINVILSTTGYAAFLGRFQVQGLGMAESTINAAGGIAGRPVKFVINDDQSSPQVAVQLASALLAKGVTAILGPALVSSCQAIQPLVKGKA